MIDAQLLAFVYIEMTRRQEVLNLSAGSSEQEGDQNAIIRLPMDRKPLKVVRASADEIVAHESRLDIVADKGSEPIWRKR